MARPRGPKAARVEACVAMAPAPARAHGTRVPTVRARDATATPTSPVAVSQATIEKVPVSGEASARAETKSASETTTHFTAPTLPRARFAFRSHTKHRDGTRTPPPARLLPAMR